MTDIVGTGLKTQPRPNIAIEKALRLVDKHAVKTSGGVISFKEWRRVMGWLYHLDKEESNRFSFELKEMGLIEEIVGHGIRLLKMKWEWF